VARPLIPPLRSPAPPPQLPIHPQIVAAETQQTAGDLKGVEAALAAITPAEQAAFRPVERERHQRLVDFVTARRQEELARRLARALDAGDLRLLSSTIAAMPANAEWPREVKKDLARARQAVKIDARLARAQQAGDSIEVIRQTGLLLELVPRAARARELRERIAAAVETEVDDAIDAGQLETALSRLDALRQAWPDRPQLARRGERIAAERKVDQSLEALLAAAGRLEKANDPLTALQLLAGTKPNRRFEGRFQEARQRLEAQFAQLDRRPPELALQGSPEPVYEKGKTATIPLRITDDFGVKGVRAWARTEGGAYVEVTVRHLAGAEYACEISPELHQNKAIEFYATASDGSGHVGQLGSAGRPLRLKR
jgi:hypothetical protein